MQMATTKYSVFAGGEDEARETRSNKAKAIELATALREDEKVEVRVLTDKGTVVFEQAAPKKIRMSKPFTRTVELPEGIEVPEGKRVAYKRPRRGFAVLHDPSAEKGEQYSLLNLKTGEEGEERYATTRECGDVMTNA